MGPPMTPPVGRTAGPLCRYPSCNRPVFFDRRVNDYREWCSEQHMQAAIAHGVEKPCNVCRIWPRRIGHKCCSGNSCGYTYPERYSKS